MPKRTRHWGSCWSSSKNGISPPPQVSPEGLEETLTLHRLGVYGVLGASFKTTNCIESVNALIEERCAKVDAWKNSNQRHRLRPRSSTSNRDCDA